MEIGILGPLVVRAGGQEITPTADKPRRLLALIAARAGQVVPVATLIDELWGSEPPRTAAGTVQTYVLRLRRLVVAATGRAGEAGLATRHGGYLVDPAVVRVDADSYRHLAESGYQALTSGDLEKAARSLRAALRLWRGSALADLPPGPELALDADRLTEERAAVLDALVEADLRLGRHHELLDELGGLVARHPLHERLCSQYMVALYQSGRRRDALTVYRTASENLRENLGIEPSSRLRNLAEAIVRAGPESAETPTGLARKGN